MYDVAGGGAAVRGVRTGMRGATECRTRSARPARRGRRSTPEKADANNSELTIERERERIARLCAHYRKRVSSV